MTTLAFDEGTTATLSRLREVHHLRASDQQTLARHVYTYDPTGNKTRVEDHGLGLERLYQYDSVLQYRTRLGHGRYTEIINSFRTPRKA